MNAIVDIAKDLSVQLGRTSALLTALSEILARLAVETLTDQDAAHPSHDSEDAPHSLHRGRRRRTVGRQPQVEELDGGCIVQCQRRGAFERYELCQHKLTAPQWKAVCLHYRDDKSQSDVADLLCISRSSVSGLLNRAERRMDAYHRRLRAEETKLLRNHLNS